MGGLFIDRDCAIRKNAQKLAAQKGLDSTKVSCLACEEGGPCPYSGEEAEETFPVDEAQDRALMVAEGHKVVERFYDRLQSRADMLNSQHDASE